MLKIITKLNASCVIASVNQMKTSMCIMQDYACIYRTSLIDWIRAYGAIGCLLMLTLYL